MSEKHLEQFFASAIKFNPSEKAKVVARGNGALAKQIESTARLHNIPVLQNFALSKTLSNIPLGDDIPQTLYFTIAKLFACILELEEQPTEE